MTLPIVPADLEQVRLLEHIKTSGLIAPFVDFLGNQQDAPEAVAGILDLTSEYVLASKRYIQVRMAGGEQQTAGDIGYTQRPVQCNVFSTAATSDSAVTEMLAKSIEQWLLANYESESHCIISIEVQGCNGPYLLEEGRVFFEIPMIVKFSR